MQGHHAAHSVLSSLCSFFLKGFTHFLYCCRDLAVKWDEGGMPWTCLPGEPSDVNWCNDPSGWDLYKNPPQAWRGANDHGTQPGCVWRGQGS